MANNFYRLIRHSALSCVTLFLVLVSGTNGNVLDHSEHNNATEDSSHDSHQMTSQMLEVMRERIPSYREFSDQQIALQMQMMAPDDSRYLSGDSVNAEHGVLALIHGFGETGDRIIAEALQPMANIFPSAISAGMSMMNSAHIQDSLNDLENAGVNTVVVVPLVSSKRNTLMYQWQYIFSMRDRGGYYDVPQVNTDARLVITDPPGGHPLITQILLDHALEMSTDPSKEVVFIIAHGPVFEEENQAQLEIMAGQAKRIQKIGGFSHVEGVTLQDDAVAEVRDANVAKLRRKIEDASADGKKVLVVTDLLAARSIQWKVERDLAGLDYEFSIKGVSMHPNFRQWFQETVAEAMMR